MAELAHQFDSLESTTKDKGLKLFDANRQVLYEQTCDDIDGWICDLESQILTGETGQDLTSVNILMEQQTSVETQMSLKAQQVLELQSQADYLQRLDPDKTPEILQKRQDVEGRSD